MEKFFVVKLPATHCICYELEFSRKKLLQPCSNLENLGYMLVSIDM